MTEKKLSSKKKIFVLIRMSCVIISIGIILLPAFCFYEYHSKAKSSLMDAKIIQLAMRVLSIQYYGEDRSVYVPNTQSGMDKETIKEVQYLSGTEGEITLISWNVEDNVPEKFYYKTDTFLVAYLYDTYRKELIWDVFYIKPVIKLGK